MKSTPINIILDGYDYHEIGIIMYIEKLNIVNKIASHNKGCIISLLLVLKNINEYKKYLDCNDRYKNLRNLIYELSDETFEKIKSNCLYIHYFDTHKNDYKIKFNYKSRQELYDTIMKSIYISSYTENSSIYDLININCINPYCFENDKYKTLYVRENLMDKIYSKLSNETPLIKILKGETNIKRFLKNNKINSCRYIEKNNTFNIFIYRIIQIILTIMLNLYTSIKYTFNINIEEIIERIFSLCLTL